MQKVKIKFGVSPFFALLGVVMAYAGRIQLFLSYVVAMVLHELAHAEVANKRGYALNKLKIKPYGASISGNLDHVTASDEIAIAVAGPLCSVCAYFFTVALWWIFPDLYFFTSDFACANISLVIFNLLPVYPLDGGRVLYAILRKKLKKPYKVVTAVGIITSVVISIAVVALLYNKLISPISAITVMFVAISAVIPEKRCKYAKLYELSYRVEKCKSCLPIRFFTVTKQTDLRKMKSKLSGDAFTFFCVIDDGKKMIAETELDLVYDFKDKQTVDNFIKK